MRRNFSSPTLSPPPPYPSTSPPKDPPVLPATAPPSPELPSSEITALAQETEDMRATHIRPRTAPASPERPGTAYSTRSTIRQVQPSPDSLSEAFANGFADGGTPAPAASYEPFPPFDSSQQDDTGKDDHGTHIPCTEPSTPASALQRGGTPSQRSLSRKSRSCSPQKSRSRSPRKHIVRTPSLPAHQESPSSTYSADKWEAPDTPSPVTREQQRKAYAPLQVRRPFAEANEEGEPAGEQGTHARIADSVSKMETQQQRGGKTRSSQSERSNVEVRVEVPEQTKRVIAPVPHIVQAMAQPTVPAQTRSPFSAAQKQAQKEKGPVRHTSVSRCSEASGASVASKHSIFSTPGRDEMERKKPIVEEDEGPFAKAMGMQDLEQRRRKVSEGARDGEEKNEKRKVCGMKCVVM